MSYCRFGPISDVYLYADAQNGKWTCCQCRLNNETAQRLATAAQVLHHLEQHQAAGHMVPQYAIDKIVREEDL